ncbi:MAG TPA: NAD(P)/FAD-dependent oxidoreductase [Gemmatimonadaceae bacterium]|nr:NAD(P)/FAD-dependent oxidoreductase [Gemmatimonadaceae bacterium]
MPEATAIVVGAGASGLSAAAALKRKGIDVVVLDQHQRIGETWARRYDRLHLHTPRAWSGLAHFGIPWRYPRYLSRDQFVEYLNEYAKRFQLRVIAPTTVRKIAKDSSGKWKISTNNGEWNSRAVVVATGQYSQPVFPTWPGAERYTGELIHASKYSKPAPYAGKRVLVVGPGNTGSEIAMELAENGAAFVALSIRTPPPIVPRDPFGMPIAQTSLLLSMLPTFVADTMAKLTSRIVLGDLTEHGIPRAAWAPYSSKRVPLIDVGIVAAIKKGIVKVRPALERLSENGAVFVDGKTEPFDVVIAATGYTAGLDQLLDSKETLNDLGEPADTAGEPTASPGLFFVGYTHSLRGHLFESNVASKRAAKNVQKYLT